MIGAKPTLAFAAALALLLAACGDADADADAGGDEQAGDNGEEVDEPDEEFDAEEYFSGETVTVLVGFSAGGGMDQYARLFTEFMPDFLPGSPRFIVENVTGAGGAVVGGMIQDETEPDGLTLGLQGNFSLAESIEDETVPFRPTNLEFIGDLSPDPPACVFRTELGSTLEEIQAIDRPLNMGSTGPSAGGTVWANAMQAWMDVDVNIVSGYPGTQEIQLAFEQGELDGYCNGIASVFIDAGAMFRDGSATLITYHGADPLGGVFPDSITTTEITDDMWAPNMVSDDEASGFLAELGAVGRGYHKAFALPPETPEEIITAYADAMAAMVEDPDFLELAEQTNRPIQFLTREEVTERAEAVNGLSEPVRDMIREALQGGD